MYRIIFYPILRIDWVLLLLVLTLGSAGMVALVSATSSADIYERQLTYAYIGLALLLVCACIPWRAWKWLSLPLYLGCLLLLIAVAIFGVEANNARRWLNLGIFSLQPSELAKFVVPLVLACFYCLFKERRFWQHIVALVLLLVPTLLVFSQPDLGTAVMIAIAGLMVIFFSGLPWWFMGGSTFVAVLATPLLWSAALKDYQRDRILSVLDPYQDPLGAGYHTIQSSIAVGSGGMLGKGWGLGTQSQLGFLPEKHTDFIFAVFAEEFGFRGSVILLGLIMLLFMRMLWISGFAKDEAGNLMAASLATVFLLQSLINLGMVSGVLPVVGLPLPLVSYGGTSLLVLAVIFGVFMAVAKHKPSIN